MDAYAARSPVPSAAGDFPEEAFVMRENAAPRNADRRVLLRVFVDNLDDDLAGGNGDESYGLVTDSTDNTAVPFVRDAHAPSR